MHIEPISIKNANAYVEEHHRHHGKKTGCRFAIGIFEGGVLHGVAICSNPVARNADDGLTLEVARLCTDGIKNGCSMLYGACARIAKDMGFRKIQTYILETENGASLKASGWKCEGIAGDINWQRCNSQRQNMRDATAQLSLFPQKKPPEVMKTRWAKYLVPTPYREGGQNNG